MAAPLFAPFVSLIPVLKILALGSLKFVGVGIGAAIAPVMTANFLVGIAAGTPLKYAKFRQQKGHFSVDDLALIEKANELIADSLEKPDLHLSRAEAQEFLKDILLTTLAGMKESVTSVPARVTRMTRQLIDLVEKQFSS
ncbi:MAG: hypothetical protein ACPGSC_14045, partial [Granulosicoccaceae bacterium]